MKKLFTSDFKATQRNFRPPQIYVGNCSWFRPAMNSSRIRKQLNRKNCENRGHYFGTFNLVGGPSLVKDEN